MLAHNKIIPLIIWSFGFSDQVNCLLNKKNMIGSVKATVKKYLAHVICSTGMSALKYLAIPSINGRNTQANKFKIIAFTFLIKVFQRNKYYYHKCKKW